MRIYDVVVVGGGSVGSCAAYYATQEGRGTEQVLLLEQFAPGHERGSAHGESRIIRRSYPEPEYAQLMPEAYALWRDAEARSGESLIRTTGGIDFGPAGSPMIESLVETCKAQQIPHELVPPADARVRFPGFAGIPDDFRVVHCPETGIINADAAGRVMRELAVATGRCTVVSDARVTAYGNVGAAAAAVAGAAIEVRCADGRVFGAHRVIVCPGAWITQQLTAMGLRVREDAFAVTKMTYGFWNVPEQARPAFTHPGPGRVFIYYAHDMRETVYGFPINETAGRFKAAVHQSPHVVPDPYSVSARPEPDLIDGCRAFLARFCRGHGVGESTTTSGGGGGGNTYGNCLYTVPAPDADGQTFCVADLHPADPRIVVIGALHGQGFKMCNVLGKIAAEWVCRGAAPARFDLRRFNLARFLVDRARL
jgi:sarcosine oxidase